MSKGTHPAAIWLNLTYGRIMELPTGNEQTPPLFPTLPQEILSAIAKHLSYASTLALRYTCRMLYAELKLFKNKSYRMCDLVEIERWPCYDFAGHYEKGTGQPLASLDYFACHICLKLRSAGQFSNAMMKGKRGKRSPAGNPEAENRCCIPCGIRSDIYKPGTSMCFGGSWHDGGGLGVVCIGCKCLKVEVRDRRCQPCLDKAMKYVSGERVRGYLLKQQQ